MTESNEAALHAALALVEDPVLFHPLGELGILKAVRAGRRSIEVTVEVPPGEYPATHELTARLTTALPADERRPLDLRFVEMDETRRNEIGALLKTMQGESAAGGEARENPFTSRSSRTRVLAIASGKGGVGKSSVTVSLAVALARAGHSVGLLDADIHGFSVPRMLKVGYAPLVLGKTILPPVARGVRAISMGFFVDEDKAVAWRGPMLHRALEQFLNDVHWGAPEFLVVDMPPGTGDIALSVGQQLPRAELYLVTTPQLGSARIAQRAGSLARQLRLPIRGVIENMSYFRTPDGTRYELFGSGGGELLAKTLEAPLLAKVPLVPAVGGEDADEGIPAVIADPEGEVAHIFADLAEQIIAAGPARIYRSELSIS
jgi:ATP-binding protein involved in chromosome partitioning